MRAAKYIGPDNRVRVGERRLKTGDMIIEPPAVVDSLLARSDFEEVGVTSYPDIAVMTFGEDTDNTPEQPVRRKRKAQE